MRWFSWPAQKLLGSQRALSFLELMYFTDSNHCVFIFMRIRSKQLSCLCFPLFSTHIIEYVTTYTYCPPTFIFHHHNTFLFILCLLCIDSSFLCLLVLLHGNSFIDTNLIHNFYINYIKLWSSICFERHPLIFRSSMMLIVHVCSLWYSYSLQVAVLCTC